MNHDLLTWLVDVYSEPHISDMKAPLEQHLVQWQLLINLHCSWVEKIYDIIFRGYPLLGLLHLWCLFTIYTLISFFIRHTVDFCVDIVCSKVTSVIISSLLQQFWAQLCCRLQNSRSNLLRWWKKSYILMILDYRFPLIPSCYDPLIIQMERSCNWTKTIFTL